MGMNGFRWSRPAARLGVVVAVSSGLALGVPGGMAGAAAADNNSTSVNQPSASVSEPNVSVSLFLQNADPSQVTTADAIGFVDGLEKFLGSADGSGTHVQRYQPGSSNDFSGVFTHSWVTRDQVTLLEDEDGDRVFSPRGEYVEVLSNGGQFPFHPTRGMFAIPKSKKVDWALSSEYPATCEFWCSSLAFRVFDRVLEGASVERPESGPIVWTFTFDGDTELTVSADMASGNYTLQYRGEPYGGIVTETTTATMVTPSVVPTIPNRFVATGRQYRDAFSVLRCGSMDFKGIGKHPFQLPSARDLKKIAGKTVKNGPCTYKIPKKAAGKGVWMIKLKEKFSDSKKWKAIRYSPKSGLVESAKYRR